MYTQEPWYHAIQRCLDECNNLAESIRRLSEDNLENNSPHFVFCIFIAARFLLGKCTVYIVGTSHSSCRAHWFYAVRSRTLQVDVPRCFDLLLYGLNVCAQRWYFASKFIYIHIHQFVPLSYPQHLISSTLDLRFN
jgi:hypothetical protein